MTRNEYEKIMSKIYDNGCVVDQEGISEDTEFHFEAKEQGFSDQEIEEAREHFA